MSTSTEEETLQRVQGALYHLRRGLAPFVEARMKARHGAQWSVYASRAFQDLGEIGARTVNGAD